MREAVSTALQSNNFDLKHDVVQLVPSAGVSRRASVTLTDLESMRTAATPVPASRFGLEVICGASCETGAQ